MAAGDTKLKICSDALISIGAKPISSFTDGGDDVTAADRLYDAVRDTLLQMYPWPWSITKVQLARLAAAPTTEWTYKYQLPGDIFGPPKAVFLTSQPGAASVLDWEIYGTELLTDYSEVWIDYQFLPDESLMPPHFVRLLRAAVAAELAIPVTDSTTKASYWHGMAFGTPQDNMRGGLFRVAASIDGNRPAQAINDFPLVAVRG